jgi:Tfp pilus assembly protein PilE
VMRNLVKRQDRGYTVVELVIAVAGVAAITGVVVAICVAVHFIAKLW